MRAGQLRHRLIVERPVVTEAPDGSQVVTYAPAYEDPVWGRIEPLRMTEQLIAAQVDARMTHRITLRYLPLPPTYRLREQGTGRIFEPTGIKNMDERNRELQIMAIEQVAG